MSFAEELLQKVESLLLGKADDDVKSIDYDGKSLNTYSFEDLMKLRSKLKAEIKAAQKAEAIANGLNPKNRVVTRFM